MTPIRNTPASAAPPRPRSAPSLGAHIAQFGSCPSPPSTLSYEDSDGRPILRVSGLHRPHKAKHLHRHLQCHPRPGPMDHNCWRLPRSLTGALYPGSPRFSKHPLCLQSSFRGVLCRMFPFPPMLRTVVV